MYVTNNDSDGLLHFEEDKESVHPSMKDYIV